MPGRSLVLLTRYGCGLCDEALRYLQRPARWMRCDIEIRNIAEDVALEQEYHLRIPVVLDKHGKVLAEGAIGAIEALAVVLKASR